MLYHQQAASLIRMDTWGPMGPEENARKTIAFTEDMAMIVNLLLERKYA